MRGNGMTIPHRVMLLGAGGQIGQAIQHEVLPPDWHLGLYGRSEIDITNPSSVRDAVQGFKPDVVINAAGMADIDRAECNPAAAMDANFHAAAILAAQCSMLDVPLIHLSSAAVFDGEHDAPYKPDDPMNPLNAFGQSKMMGEEAVRHELPWHVILRLSWVFGAFGENILTRALHLIDDEKELCVSPDRLGAPAPAPDVARALLAIAEALLGGKAEGFGTFHLCGTPPCTPFDFTQALVEAYAPYAGHRPEITRLTEAEENGFGRRPRYAVLDCEKIQAVYGIEQPAWRAGLIEAVRSFVSQKDARS
jgi:dTDP-4-dehydrorhamnose reductase